jgi:ketosteroid isomerase-like protein
VKVSLFTSGKIRVTVVLTLLAVLSVSLLSTRTAAAQKISPEQAIQLQKRLLAVMTAGDWKTTADMMSDNLVYIHPTGLVNTKQQRMDALLKGPTPFWSNIESKDVHAQVFTDTAVITSETIFTHAPAPGSNTPGSVLDLRFTSVWANERGTWRMVLFHCTTIPPPKKS